MYTWWKGRGRDRKWLGLPMIMNGERGHWGCTETVTTFMPYRIDCWLCFPSQLGRCSLPVCFCFTVCFCSIPFPILCALLRSSSPSLLRSSFPFPLSPFWLSFSVFFFTLDFALEFGHDFFFYLNVVLHGLLTWSHVSGVYVFFHALGTGTTILLYYIVDQRYCASFSLPSVFLIFLWFSFKRAFFLPYHPLPFPSSFLLRVHPDGSPWASLSRHHRRKYSGRISQRAAINQSLDPIN